MYNFIESVQQQGECHFWLARVASRIYAEEVHQLILTKGALHENFTHVHAYIHGGFDIPRVYTRIYAIYIYAQSGDSARCGLVLNKDPLL